MSAVFYGVGEVSVWKFPGDFGKFDPNSNGADHEHDSIAPVNI